MKTSTITIKVKPGIKKEAMKVADELGFSLSALLNGFMTDLIKNKSVVFGKKEPMCRHLSKDVEHEF